MRKLLLTLLLVAGLASCERYDDTELRGDVENLQAQNSYQADEIANLRLQLQATVSLINGEVARLQALVDELDRRNLSLSDNFQAVQAQLVAAVDQLESADESNLATALAAVANAESALADALENNIEEVQEALSSLGAVDSNLLSQIDNILVALNTLRDDLSAEDVNLQQAINDANALIEAANEAIATNAAAIAELREQITALSATVDAIDFVDNSELEERLVEVISALQNYADTNDDNTIFDPSDIINLINDITNRIDTNEVYWLADQFEANTDTQLTPAEVQSIMTDIIMGLQDAIDAIPTDDDSALVQAIDDLTVQVANNRAEIESLITIASWTSEGNVLTVALSNGATYTFNITGPQGLQGPQGVQGENGVSPQIQVSVLPDGSGYAIYINGTQYIVRHGENGQDGENADLCDIYADSVQSNFVLPPLDRVVYLDVYSRTASGTKGVYEHTIGYVVRGEYLRLFDDKGWFSVWGRNIREMDATGGNPYQNFYIEGSTSTPTFVQPDPYDAPVTSGETDFTLNYEFDAVTGEYRGCLEDTAGENIVWYVNGVSTDSGRFTAINVGDLNGIYIISAQITIDGQDYFVQHTVEKSNSGKRTRSRGSVRVRRVRV